MKTQLPPDDDDIRFVLEAQLGKQTQLEFFEPTPGSPIDAVIKSAKQLLQTEFLTYWAKGGSPRIFGMGDFSKPVVVFSERIVEIWANFRDVFTNDQFDPRLKQDLIERTVLRTMAEVSFSIVDDPSMPVQLSMAAAKRCPGVLFLPNAIANLEYEARGLGYMNCWFFAFAHELGHFPPVLLPETLLDLVEGELINGINSLDNIPKPYRDQVIRQVREGQIGPLLDISQIMIEAHADACAMVILFESSLSVMKDAGKLEEFSMEGFYHETILSMNFVATLGQIEQLISVRRHGVASLQLALEMGFYRGVIGARANVAFHLFSIYLHERYPNSEIFDPDAQAKIFQKIATHLDRHIVAWDNGLESAITTLISLSMPQDVDGFIHDLNMVSDTSELRHLIDIVEAAGKTSWHLRALKRKVVAPERDIEITDLEISSTGHSYLITTLSVDGKERIPACLHTGQDLICFVFLTKVLFEDFVELLKRMLGHQVEVATVSLQVRSEEDLFEQIGMWLRPHVRPMVLIQGSETFDRQYLHFLDQTERIGKIGVFLP